MASLSIAAGVQEYVQASGSPEIVHFGSFWLHFAAQAMVDRITGMKVLILDEDTIGAPRDVSRPHGGIISIVYSQSDILQHEVRSRVAIQEPLLGCWQYSMHLLHVTHLAQ